MSTKHADLAELANPAAAHIVSGKTWDEAHTGTNDHGHTATDDGGTLALTALPGVTASAAEINLIDGSVAGTAVASKALALGVDKNVDELHVAALYLGAGAGTAVDATAAELNAVAGKNVLALTTVAASDLVIPITHRQVWKTTGAVAEALSLADGAHGQMVSIVLSTDGGGDGTLTPTTKNGFTSIVFADAGDQATLQFFTGLGWIIVGTAGLVAPPALIA